MLPNACSLSICSATQALLTSEPDTCSSWTARRVKKRSSESDRLRSVPYSTERELVGFVELKILLTTSAVNVETYRHGAPVARYYLHENDIVKNVGESGESQREN